MDKHDLAQLREHCLRNAKGLISPANSGLIIALALFECADALRAQAVAQERQADMLMFAAKAAEKQAGIR